MQDNGPLAQRLTISSDGLTLVAESVGARDAPPVVFLHGGGQTRGSWKQALPTVAAHGFRAVAYDARGHGESDWSPTGDYDLPAFVADLSAVVAVLGRPPVLVGASLGGYASLAWLGAAPAPPALGLVMVDAVPRANQAGSHRIQAFMRGAPDGFASIEDAAAAVAAYSPHRPRPPTHDGLRRNLRLRDGRYHWHWDPAFIGMAAGVRQGWNATLEAAARNVAAPTLLVHAARSDVVTEEEVRHFLALIPLADYVRVAGTGHMVAGDANDVFNAAILDFLRSLPIGNAPAA